MNRRQLMKVFAILKSPGFLNSGGIGLEHFLERINTEKSLAAAKVEKYNQEIISILATAVGSGSFRKPITLGNGETWEHPMSWNVGMCSSYSEQNYKQRFNLKFPAWVDLLHPAHVLRVSRYAIELGIPLPALISLNVGGYLIQTHAVKVGLP